MIQAFSWADLGYRRLPEQIRTLHGEAACKMLRNVGKFDTLENEWIRHPARWQKDRRPQIRIVTEIQRNFDKSEIEVLRDDFEWYLHLYSSGMEELPRVVMDEDEFLLLLADVEKEYLADQPWRFLSILSQTFYLAHNFEEFTRRLTEHSLPLFFKFYPESRVLFLSHRNDLVSQNSSLRFLYTASMLPIAEWPSASLDGFGTMRDWHGKDPYILVLNVLAIYQYLWMPFVSGAVSGLYGSRVLLLLSPAPKYSGPLYPSDWLALLKDASEFGAERIQAEESMEVLFDTTSDKHARLVHRRLLASSMPSIDQRNMFFRWLVSRLDQWTLSIYDCTNYVEKLKDTTVIEPVSGFEFVMTINRIVGRLGALMQLKDIGVAKPIVFEIADLMATLRVRLRSGSGQSEVDEFKDFFNAGKTQQLLCDILKTIPGVGDNLADQAECAYRELVEVIKQSILFKDRLTATGVMVPGKTAGTEREEPFEQFAANVIRVLRNGHHGYFTEGDDSRRVSRYLWMVSGNVPDSIRALPMLWFLAYITEPSFLGWNAPGYGVFAK